MGYRNTARPQRPVPASTGPPAPIVMTCIRAHNGAPSLPCYHADGAQDGACRATGVRRHALKWWEKKCESERPESVKQPHRGSPISPRPKYRQSARAVDLPTQHVPRMCLRPKTGGWHVPPFQEKDIWPFADWKQNGKSVTDFIAGCSICQIVQKTTTEKMFYPSRHPWLEREKSLCYSSWTEQGTWTSWSYPSCLNLINYRDWIQLLILEGIIK